MTESDRVAWKWALLGLACNAAGFGLGVLAIRTAIDPLAYVAFPLVVAGSCTMGFVILYKILQPSGNLLEHMWGRVWGTARAGTDE